MERSPSRARQADPLISLLFPYSTGPPPPKQQWVPLGLAVASELAVQAGVQPAVLLLAEQEAQEQFESGAGAAVLRLLQSAAADEQPGVREISAAGAADAARLRLRQRREQQRRQPRQRGVRDREQPAAALRDRSAAAAPERAGEQDRGGEADLEKQPARLRP